ncbi:MAG: hypothetical protein K2Y31_15650 [Burkholderiales bacterium]|jgi:hypothetical protein|nr:hypothetical protein [Burkholderiales bacterium]
MKKILIASLFFMTFVGCIGYAPGHQSYWDAQVREMCEKDGGVKIYEKLKITKIDIDLLGKVDGNIGVPIKALAHPNALAYAELKITDIKEWNPRVTRSESIIIRRADQAVIPPFLASARSGVKQRALISAWA